MDGRLLAAIIVVVALLGILTLMALAWRRRVVRDAPSAPEATVPEPRPRAELSLTVLYVATSEHDRPLERLALPGLGFRSRVAVEVSGAGVIIDVPGERPTFVPADAIVGIDQTNLTIDRVVEPGGLIRLSWRPRPEVVADSTFRVLEQADRARLIDAVTAIIPTREAELQPSITPDSGDAPSAVADEPTSTQNESAS
ncbi:hypothetical protein KXS11_05130 [Plantibacter flavus]|uniref:PH-like domain-containing protein n=1 Tax=Plantibacter flavus TaxID=150123 RepID=UPI003F16CEC8